MLLALRLNHDIRIYQVNTHKKRGWGESNILSFLSRTFINSYQFIFLLRFNQQEMSKAFPSYPCRLGQLANVISNNITSPIPCFFRFDESDPDLPVEKRSTFLQLSLKYPPQAIPVFFILLRLPTQLCFKSIYLKRIFLLPSLALPERGLRH